MSQVFHVETGAFVNYPGRPGFFVSKPGMPIAILMFIEEFRQEEAMKTTSLKKAFVLLMAVAMLAGCAQEKSAGGSTDGGNNPAGTPTPGPGATPTPLPDNHPLNNEAGSTVSFQFTDIATLNDYVQSRPINNPQNMKINVKLTDVGGGRYDGSVKLGYYDTGTYYIGIFNTTYSGSQYQPSPTSPVLDSQTYKNAYRGMLNSQFNNWFMSGGKRVFHGFFQDRLGAVVLVITGGVDQGDGGGYSEVNGEIWYKNFEVAPAAQSPTQCWFQFTPSPYRCGTFYTCGSDSGNCAIANSGRPLRPGNGYKLLGTFQSLNKSRAFGN